MRVFRLRALGVAMAAVVSWSTSVSAQSGGVFHLTRTALASGGATFSSGGAFQLGGSIAQPNAAISGGGAFTLQSGFWAGYVSSVLGVEPGSEEFPKDFQLMRAAPNPFNATTVLSFELPRESSVRLTIYDVTGHRVRTLVDQSLAPGTHHVRWDGRDAGLAAVPAGVYFASFEAQGFHATTRIVLLH
jgi:hypothetical protein